MPQYWAAHSCGGRIPTLCIERDKLGTHLKDEKAWDPICAALTMCGYHIQAIDGEIGHVEDFIIDDETWAIRYVVVDTRNWWPGNKVLISPNGSSALVGTIESLCDLSRETIKKSPQYTEESLVTRGL